MGKVYTRLILSTLQPEEDYIDGMIRIYNDEICDTIDNYNSSAYYEPSYVITRAYNNGGFYKEVKNRTWMCYGELYHKRKALGTPGIRRLLIGLRR